MGNGLTCHRPGEGLRFGEAGVVTRRKLSISPVQAAAAAGLNGVPSASMRCMMTASLRASATFAFCMPARLGELGGPALEVRAFDRLGQDDVGGLIEGGGAPLLSPIFEIRPV